MYRASVLVISTILAVNIVYAANKGEECGNLSDCADAGTTCFHGKCVCWIDMSFSVGMTWACDVDAGCGVLFPGHVCRKTHQCREVAQRFGYCQPEEAANRWQG